MAAFIFSRMILAGEPIPLYNNGDMRRDFTYIDDIVDGILSCLDRPPSADGGGTPFRLYNLGNSKSERLLDFIAVIEKTLGRKAEVELLPMQPGDVKETYADISNSQKDLGFEPAVTIEEGVPRFINWYREYYGA